MGGEAPAEVRALNPSDAVLERAFLDDAVIARGWDAAGASAFGFTTTWVNRVGLPQDRLPAAPHHILPDLSRLPELLA